jgi:hypothetical protein
MLLSGLVMPISIGLPIMGGSMPDHSMLSVRAYALHGCILQLPAGSAEPQNSILRIYENANSLGKKFLSDKVLFFITELYIKVLCDHRERTCRHILKGSDGAFALH